MKDGERVGRCVKGFDGRAAGSSGGQRERRESGQEGKSKVMRMCEGGGVVSLKSGKDS